MADITDIERLNYYEGEYLGAIDFEAEQEYHRDMRRRHNIGPHTWGIVTGLDIAQFPNGGPNNEVDIFIQPGVAVDGFGREIVVFSPYQLTAEMFADFPAKQTLTVWIGYSQQMINPDSDTCASANQTNAFSRVQESFQVVIQPFPPTIDPVYVGGNVVTPPSAATWTQPTTLPPLPSTEGAVVIALDDSVPFQELPDDNTTANWLVPLGRVLWDGVNQVFVQSANGSANQNRQYVGSVASTIYAPAGILTIQDRSTLSSAIAGGSAPSGPATVTAYSAAGGTVTLTVNPAMTTPLNAGQLVIFSGFSSGLSGLNGQGFSVLGTPSPSATSFAISSTSVTGVGFDTGSATPQPLGVFVEVQGTLTVDEQLTAQQDVWLNGGNLYALRFKDAGGTDNGTGLNLQRLDASGGGADLHIHIGDGGSPQTIPQRLTVGYGKAAASQDTNAFIVGCDGNVDIPEGSLSFGTQQAQVLNLYGTNYGIGVQIGSSDSSLYFRSASDFAWYANGKYSSTPDSAGTGGTVSMILDSSGDLTINGALVVDNADANGGQVNPGITLGNASGEGIASKRSSGGNQHGLDFYTGSDVRMSITNGGSVGIGTTAPGATLDVRGNVGSNSVFGFSSVQQSTSPYGVCISAPVSQTMGLFTNFNQQVTINSSGNVGIGTTSPATLLEVNKGSVAGGGIQIDGTNDTRIKIGQGMPTVWSWSNGWTTPGDFSLIQEGVSGSVIYVKPGGNVGIGTTTPAATLQVNGPANSPTTSGSQQNAMLYVGGPGGNGLFTGVLPASPFTSWMQSGFQVPSTGAWYPISLNPLGGNVGIGTTNPQSTLQVDGNLTVNGNLQLNGVFTATGSKTGYVVDRFYSRAKKVFQQGDVLVLHTKPTAIYYGIENRIPLVEVTLSTKACDTRVCGIVDEPVLPADRSSDLDPKALGKGTVGLMVTLGAYAYCKVDADIAPITAGDLLTTSDTPGHAQRYDPELSSATGCIIGKALASLEKGKGKIPILISHQ